MRLTIIIILFILLAQVQGASAFNTSLNSTTKMVDLLNPDGSVNRTIYPVGMHSMCNLFFNYTCDPNRNSEFLFSLNAGEGNYSFGIVFPAFESVSKGLSISSHYIPLPNSTDELRASPAIWLIRQTYLQSDEPNYSVVAERDGISNNYNDSKLYYPNKLVFLNNWRDALSWMSTTTNYLDIYVTDAYINKISWVPTYYNRNDFLYAHEHRVTVDAIGSNSWNATMFQNKTMWYLIEASALNNSGLFTLNRKEGRGESWLAIAEGFRGIGFYGFLSYPENSSAPAGTDQRTLAHLALNETKRKWYGNISNEVSSLNNILIMPTASQFWLNDQNISYTNVTPNPTKTISIGVTKNVPQFTYLYKQVNSSLSYLILVNKDSNTTNDVQIWAGGMIGNQTVTLLGNETEGSGRSTVSDPTRTLNAVSGKFNDSIDGQAVHIYEISSDAAEEPPVGNATTFTIKGSGGDATWSDYWYEGKP